MSVEKSDLVAIRYAAEEDRNFILATWLRGLYYGDTWFREVPKEIFMTEYHKILNNILASPNTKIYVACLIDDPDVILGYAVTNQAETTLSWVFVKSAWRGIGIAKGLMPKSITSVTHLTKVGLSILRKHPQVIFNPFVTS